MSTHIENIEHIENAHFHNNDKPSLPSNIPSPKGFIGRETELTSLHQAKTGGKASFVLHGIGGVGKTDLALKFIDGIKGEFQTYIRVDMFGLSDKPTSANDGKLEVIRMFKPDVPANLEDKDISNLYISLLNHYQTILFFDNAKNRDQVIPLCKDVPALVVITSRTNLYVAGCFSLPVEQMSPANARNLLYSVADEKRFNGQADALAYLAGYLPMALLPLGGMLAEYITLEVVELVTKYADRKERLQLADPNRENLSVEASFALSYERLSVELQTCWRKLAVFPADFDLKAMQAVWQIADGKAICDELVKKHLIEFNPKSKRFHLHDLSRDYTLERITWKERGNSEFLHSQHFAQVLSKLNEILIENVRVFDDERTNIEKGFSWIESNKDNKNWKSICFDYTYYSNDILRIKLHARKYVGWMKTAIMAAQKLGNETFEMLCWGNLGIAHNLLSEYDKANECLEKTLGLARKLKDKRNEAKTLHELGINFENLAKYRKAIDYSEQARIIAHKYNDFELESKCLGNLGNIYSRLGKIDEGEKCHTEALRIIKKTGNPHLINSKLGALGIFYIEVARYEEGIVLVEQSLKTALEFGDKDAEISCLGNLGNAYFRTHDKEKAKEYYAQASKTATEIGNRDGKATYTANIGNVYLEQGKYTESIPYFEEGLKVFREIGNRLGEGNQLSNLGIAHANLGDKEMAKDYWLQALVIYEAIESPRAESIRRNLANLESRS